MTYHWTTRNGIRVTSEVPPVRPLHDATAVTHLVWSYCHTGRKLIVGFWKLRLDKVKNSPVI